MSEDVQEGRFATAGSASNEDVLASQHTIFKLVCKPALQGPSGDEIVDIKMASIDLSNVRVPFLKSAVKLTSDGGQHWKIVTALKTDSELKPYTGVLSVAALDPSHYLIGVPRPRITVGYALTADAGKTWKFVHVDSG